MRKTHFAAAVVAIVLVLGGASAFAQENPYTKAPAATPQSLAHQQAQLDHDPAACGHAVDRALDNVGLRVLGMDGMNTRMNANALLGAARNAAAAGDDAACWHWYDRAQQVVR
jgi:hypothetical protein